MDPIPRKVVGYLGISQLVCWGVTYYLIGILGDPITAGLGWSETLVQGGFSVALLVMGIASPAVGRCIDRFGGRPVMAAGSVLAALGCAGIAAATTVVGYYAAWLILGLAMRCTLYDAAFATLAGLGGIAARRPMSRITLLGGIASTVFWPIGHVLAELIGWRGALLVYAAFALATLPLHLALPRSGHRRSESVAAATAPVPGVRARRIAGGLYALIFAGAGFLASGMSAHMIGILTGLGLAIGSAVWVSTLRGIAQSLARLIETVFGARLHPLDLNLIAVVLLIVSFMAGSGSGYLVILAAVCATLYGAGNGLSTIARGALPLILFDHRNYGAIVGRLMVPGFLLSAVAPIAYAAVIERFGATGALIMSTAIAMVMGAAAVGLRIGFRPVPQRAPEAADSGSAY